MSKDSADVFHVLRYELDVVLDAVRQALAFTEILIGAGLLRADYTAGGASLVVKLEHAQNLVAARMQVVQAGDAELAKGGG